jgi:hypothetical protein
MSTEYDPLIELKPIVGSGSPVEAEPSGGHAPGLGTDLFRVAEDASLAGDLTTVLDEGDLEADPSKDKLQPAAPRRALPKAALKPRTIVLMLTVAVGLVFGGGLGLILMPGSGGQVLLPDMDGNLTIPDVPVPTDDAYLEALDMVLNDGGEGFAIPVVGLHVPLGSVNIVDDVINPPNFTNVFRIRGISVPAERAGEGTVYLSGHASFLGRSPGNYVQENEQSTLRPGDVIKVDGQIYHYVKAMVLTKNELRINSDIWDGSQPGRLIFITCLLGNDRSTPHLNLVIFGQLAA